MDKLMWNLTKDEMAGLQDLHLRRIGQARLLESMQRAEGYLLEQESAWWEGVMLRLGLKHDPKRTLTASTELGKVWVKGKVVKLDERAQKYRSA